MEINLKDRSLLTLADYTPEEIAFIIDFAIQLKNEKKQGVYKKRLVNKNVALLFEKASTRTRCAFVVACADEGAHAEFLGINDIHQGGKEELKDTAKVLGRMFDLIQFRGFKQQTAECLAEYSGVPVINGLTDDDHPTQVLADLMTIKEHFGQIGGIKLVYAGDGRNNMANALMIGASKMGLVFTIASPACLMPDKKLVDRCAAYAAKSGGDIRFETDIMKAASGADVIYTDVWASMGEEDKLTDRINLLKPYQVTLSVMNAAADNAIFLHCLPAVKGNEVTEEVFEGKRSLVFDEAENRMHTIKAVMAAVLI